MEETKEEQLLKKYIMDSSEEIIYIPKGLLGDENVSYGAKDLGITILIQPREKRQQFIKDIMLQALSDSRNRKLRSFLRELISNDYLTIYQSEMTVG